MSESTTTSASSTATAVAAVNAVVSTGATTVTATVTDGEDAPGGPEQGAGAVPWDLVTVPARYGLEAVDILRRSAPSVGPVVHDGTCATLGFLVPQGTADAWDVPGSACTETAGRGITLPSLDADGGRTGTGHSAWLLPPGEGGEVTDPAVLRRALGEAARTIEAVDRCH
ncbi:hypothetical protein [Streptomyces sp. NPDC007088]|uniref:hypothetical protein n=1 Tax=Streptomyces sp. NPDC007088 TaxID=3364773 RepID=UPI0036972208